MLLSTSFGCGILAKNGSRLFTLMKMQMVILLLCTGRQADRVRGRKHK